MSVWHDKDGSAQHVLYAYHDLQPPMHSDALGPHAAVLALAPVAPPRGRAEASGERCMALIAVMQRGQLWKWSLPLPDLPRAPALASAVELSRGARPQSLLCVCACLCVRVYVHWQRF